MKDGDFEIHPQAKEGVDICFHSPVLLGGNKANKCPYEYKRYIGFVNPEFLAHQIKVKSTPAFIIGYDSLFRQVQMEGELEDIKLIGNVVYVMFKPTVKLDDSFSILGMKGGHILINNSATVEKLKQAQKKDK